MTILNLALKVNANSVVFLPSSTSLTVLIVEESSFFLRCAISSEKFTRFDYTCSTTDTTSSEESKMDNYFSVLSSAISCIVRRSLEKLRIEFNPTRHPDELVFTASSSDFAVQKRFHLRLLPTPAVILKIPQSPLVPGTVRVATSSRVWGNIFSTSKTYAVLGAQRKQVKIRFDDREKILSIMSNEAPKAKKESSAEQNSISIANSNFTYVINVSKETAGIFSEPDDPYNVDASEFVFPPSKIVRTSHLRLGCSILQTLKCDMEIRFSGPGMPIAIRSVPTQSNHKTPVSQGENSFHSAPDLREGNGEPNIQVELWLPALDLDERKENEVVKDTPPPLSDSLMHFNVFQDATDKFLQSSFDLPGSENESEIESDQSVDDERENSFPYEPSRVLEHPFDYL